MVTKVTYLWTSFQDTLLIQHNHVFPNFFYIFPNHGHNNRNNFIFASTEHVELVFIKGSDHVQAKMAVALMNQNRCRNAT